MPRIASCSPELRIIFIIELEKKDPEQRKTLLRQGKLIAVLSKIGKEIRFGKDNRIHKIERLKNI